MGNCVCTIPKADQLQLSDILNANVEMESDRIRASSEDFRFLRSTGNPSHSPSSASHGSSRQSMKEEKILKILNTAQGLKDYLKYLKHTEKRKNIQKVKKLAVE